MTVFSYRALQPSKSKDAQLLPLGDRSTPTSLASCSNGVGGIPGKKFTTPIRRLFGKLELLKPNTTSNSGIGTKRTRTTNASLNPALVRPECSEAREDQVGADIPPSSSDIDNVSQATESDLDDMNPRPIIVKHTRSPAQHYYTPSVPCMALQNSDHSIDAVVISTLLKLPFCCHEDLLTMSESQVIEVAREMNERLPEAFQIGLNEPLDADAIRREVEVLVGIVKGNRVRVPIPGAPLKRGGSRTRRDYGRISDAGNWMRDELDFKAISPPTSPLAFIAARHISKGGGEADTTMLMSPTKLGMLREEEETEEDEEIESLPLDVATPPIDSEEEEESEEEDVFRATKKRRVYASSSEDSVEMITPTMRRIRAPLMLKKMWDDMNASPTPHRVFRSSARDKAAAGGAPTGTEVGREGEKVIVKTTVIDRSLIHTRARYRSASRSSHGPLHTSTPKNARRVRENQPIPHYEMDF